MKKCTLLILLVASVTCVSGQRITDTIITTIADTITCKILRQSGHSVLFRIPKDKNTYSLHITDIHRIIKDPFNTVNLTGLIDIYGYPVELETSELAGQNTHLPRNYSRDSIPLTDSAMCYLLSGAGDHLIDFRNQYYKGVIVSFIGAGLVVFGIGLPALASLGIIELSAIALELLPALGIAGLITSFVGGIITLVSVDKAGKAGKILKEFEYFYSTP